MSAVPARTAEVKARIDLAACVQRRVPLKRAGREHQACCPFHEERTPSFTVVPDKGFIHCFGCGWHGDALKFVMDFERVAFLEALERLERECGITAGGTGDSAAGAPVRRESRKAPRGDEFVDSIDAARAVWREARPAAGSLVETYLRARNVDPRATGILEVLRFHPRCPVRLWRRWESPASATDTCEAMLVPIGQVIGPRGARRWAQQGVEVVFLAPDGRGKMRFATYRRRDGRTVTPASRKIWGDAARGACPIPPAGAPDGWLDAAGPLVVGEGLESTLSLLARVPGARGGFATLSLGNLEGKAATERDALPLHNLQADPGRPPFLVEEAGEVVIGVDADMKGLKSRRVIERPRGPVIRRDLSGLERTMICEALASAHWRAAGAGPVRTARPAMGMDFNDEAKRRAA